MFTMSVLMSCYNAARYLPPAIESVLSQSYSDYEFIVINDGSTDNTLDILQRYASQDERVVVLSKENTGLADSLNHGLRVARGEWIARQDADDISLPDRCARQVAYLRRNPSVFLLGSGCILIDEHGTPGRQYAYPTRHDALVAQICTGGSPFPHASAMFHRQSAITVGGYNSRFVRSQDVDLWLKLSVIGKIACLREPLVQIRKHNAGISNDNGGHTSMIMGMAARMCHFFAVMATSDPSQDNSDAVWEGFLQWLCERLEQQSYSESRRRWSALRQDFHSAVQAGDPVRGMLQLSRGLLASGNALPIIKNRFRASSLPSRLAKEWIVTRPNGYKAGSADGQHVQG